MAKTALVNQANKKPKFKVRGYTRCQRCGVPVTFGTLCPDCMRVMNGNKEVSYISFGSKKDRNRMRFLSDDDSKI